MSRTPAAFCSSLRQEEEMMQVFGVTLPTGHVVPCAITMFCFLLKIRPEQLQSGPMEGL